MCLFYLVQKHYAVRFTAHCISQLATFFIANVTRRRTKETRSSMFFHIFAHIKANHGAFITKHILCQSFCQFSFTNTSRAKEEEAAHRSILIFKACTSTTNSLAHSNNCSILTDDAFVKLRFQFEQSVTFTFGKFLHGDTSPRSYNFCHIISSYYKFLGNFCQSCC